MGLDMALDRNLFKALKGGNSMRGHYYQWTLISLGIVATGMFGAFLYRELNPEYKIYQHDYIELEKIRSQSTGSPRPPFEEGVKQIVLKTTETGPVEIDRCISCHVAEKFEHFSPTRVKKDKNGHIVENAEGVPEQEENPDYIWALVDRLIESTQDPDEKKKLLSLKTAQVGDHTYDVTKVLKMHPLMGKETRPFEFHPIEEYGCTSCHGGNGRGLTTETAHGPVFDGEYETEFTGPKPVFTESDPDNDPRFSRVFNHKPGHALLFQTIPILPGKLMQSKCVQCHQGETSSTEVDKLTKDFQIGKQLFISQACYACHRVAGFARGGIGPEMTNEGNGYPWFIKESIVWPQADLPTSTMPNYRMDHEEIEDITTFVLSLKGRSKAVSESAHKIALAQWESGEKLPWEKPATPAQMHDLRYGMTVFATQGCAACHRLKGFESDVGYTVEKENPKGVDFEVKYQESEWFKRLFPEEIQGSELVAQLDKYSKEIDKRIVDGVRKDSIIEEIRKSAPQVIDGLYANFKYASRAKNHHYAQLINQEKDPEVKVQLQNELRDWKERVRRVNMMFIQEYGLGRLIGPRPNWSGVYRTDEWLMEHFRNPQAHVARSIMPVFPFDSTKFYALTYMLDILGQKNRDEVNLIWEHRGFDSQQAFEIFCSQCHGVYRQGNGPISEWIYPIPKNLRNPDFLRNLTKKNAIASIMHGVKGGPMPPWGEAPKDKPHGGGIPVLTKEQINDLVDWLYVSLPGEDVFPSDQSVPKWQYTPQDVIKELHEEGGLEPFEKPSAFLTIPNEKVYYASLETVPGSGASLEQEKDVTQIFDLYPNPVPIGDDHLYYIKQKYYTPKNLEAGKEYFNINCATCHGKEGDGAGNRAGQMQEAKPRMLTNLDWLDTRDDLRLLRSIKYGVMGTAMTPWGDQTSSLQRMQLVMYIRSLSKQSERRQELLKALYESYRETEIAIEQGRITMAPSLIKAQDAVVNAIKTKEKADQHVQDEKGVAAAAKAYQNQLLAEIQLKDVEKNDELLQKIRNQIDVERTLFEGLGMSIISKNLSNEIFKTFLTVVKMNGGRFQFSDGALKMDGTEENKSKLVAAEKNLLDALQKEIGEKEKEKTLLMGKIKTPEISHRLKEMIGEISGLKQLREALESGFQDVDSKRQEQAELYKDYIERTT